MITAINKPRHGLHHTVTKPGRSWACLATDKNRHSECGKRDCACRCHTPIPQ